MDILGIIQANILTPIVLFFLLGIIAARIKSDLKIPEAISEFLPIYLLAAIGLHGGIEMRNTGFENMLVPMLVAIGLSLLFTLNHYQILRRLGKFNLYDSYALASTYGAVGAITFSVGLSFLKNQGVTSEGYLAAILAILEPVAFILAIFMTNMAVAKQLRQKSKAITTDPNYIQTDIARTKINSDDNNNDDNNDNNNNNNSSKKEQLSTSSTATTTTPVKLSKILKESITGKAIVILLGCIVIGYTIGDSGFDSISIVFDELFVGAIVIFLLEMGIIAGKRLDDIKKVGTFLITFSILMPTFNGIIGVFVATLLNLSLGGAVMFGLLLASASFIAAPAVLRHTIPQAKPSLYITSALGITFPYNIIVLLPIMFFISSILHNVEDPLNLMNYITKGVVLFR